MAKFRLTNKAVSDLEQIWIFTLETWSKNQAEIYYNQLLESCQSIAANQALGKRYPDVKKELLGFRTGKHIIFFEIINRNEILVVRILHERMDLQERLINE